MSLNLATCTADELAVAYQAGKVTELREALEACEEHGHEITLPLPDADVVSANGGTLPEGASTIGVIVGADLYGMTVEIPFHGGDEGTQVGYVLILEHHTNELRLTIGDDIGFTYATLTLPGIGLACKIEGDEESHILEPF